MSTFTMPALITDVDPKSGGVLLPDGSKTWTVLKFVYERFEFTSYNSDFISKTSFGTFTGKGTFT